MDVVFVLLGVVASLFSNADSLPASVNPVKGSIFATVGKSARFALRFTGDFDIIEFGAIGKASAIKVTNDTPLRLEYNSDYIGRISWAGNVKVSPVEVVFILSNVSQGDAERYVCTVARGAGHVNAVVELTVTDANIVEHPKSAICPTFGGEVNFTCNATGTPHPNVTWVKGEEEEEIGESNLVKIVRDGKGYSKLTIKNCGREDVLDRYRCKATNPPDLEVLSKPAVLFFPFFENDTADVDKYSSPSVVIGSIGMETTLRCAFRSYPPPSINWIFPNGSSTQTRLPFLVLTPMSSEHFGKYTCSADGFALRTVNFTGVAGNYTKTENFNGSRVHVEWPPVVSSSLDFFYAVTGTREETKEPFLTITKIPEMYLNWDSEVKNIENKKEKVTLQLEVRFHTDTSSIVIKRLHVALVAKARSLQAGFLAFVIPLVVALLSAGFQ